MNLIDIKKIYPHPDNPRKNVGDVSELADSIKENGILQNLTVVPFEDGYRVIIGHRRLAASKQAGLTELPCVIREMTPQEQVKTMLMENMQRSDLTVYEQAQGFQMMLDMGETVESIAKNSGFSQATVRRRVKMMELDQDTLKEVSERQLSLTDFDKLAKIEDIKVRNKVLKEIGTSNFNAECERTLRKQTIKKMLPVVKKLLKDAKATALKPSDTWSSKYERIGEKVYLNEWDGVKPILPKKVNGQLFYKLDETFGDLTFYEKSQKKKAPKKSRKEIDREKAISAAWERAKEIRQVTHTLRSAFINDISMTAKNQAEILKGAAASIVFRCVEYSSPDRDLMGGMLGLDFSNYDPKRTEKAVSAFEALSPKDYTMLVYSNFGDDAKLSHISGYSGSWPEYKKDLRLEALYAWLCSLGYEMSDEEKALQDGSHELFVKPEEGLS